MVKRVSFYGNGMAKALGGDKIRRDYASDPRRILGQQAMQAGSSTAPVQSPMEGLVRALQAGVGGYFQGQARKEMQDREKLAGDQMRDILAAGKVVEAAPATATRGGEFTPAVEGQEGGYSGMLEALQGMENLDPSLQGFGANLAMGQMEQEQAAAQAEAAREQQLGDAARLRQEGIADYETQLQLKNQYAPNSGSDPTSNMRDFGEYSRLVKEFGADSPEARTFKDFVSTTKVMNTGGGQYSFNPAAPTDPTLITPNTLKPSETPEHAASIEGAKKGAAGLEVRLQERVSNGIAAAKIIPTLNRSIELLDSVETGGFDNLALKAKTLFGVEGADEGELSQNLGKAVLSQLRSTFGAAFTAKEGESLKEIEAGFGKSPEANKRMLKNLLKFSQEYYSQGRSAATDLEDEGTLKSMEGFYNIKLGDGNQKPAPAQNQGPTQEDIAAEMARRGLTGG